MQEIKSYADFQEILKQDKPVLLDFYASWCGPCQTLLPTVDKLATKHKNDFIVAKIDVDSNQQLAQQFSVRSIPALFIIHEGKVKEQFIGLQTEATLNNKMLQYTA